MAQPSSSRSMLWRIAHAKKTASMSSGLCSAILPRRMRWRAFMMPKMSSMSFRIDSKTFENRLDHCSEACLSVACKQRHLWYPQSTMTYAPRSSVQEPSCLRSVNVRFWKISPSLMPMMNPSYRVIVLSLRAPGCPAVTAMMRFECVVNARVGKPPLPVFSCLRPAGHWSHAMWTTSALATAPGKPQRAKISICSARSPPSGGRTHAPKQRVVNSCTHF
mmetsp:Transcript_12116/g.41868  ORF Transcript_12116/g.41868 Transcript_12116/m.41868 type:complete len:219 (+) Transcript_12116:161-817(+)